MGFFLFGNDADDYGKRKICFWNSIALGKVLFCEIVLICSEFGECNIIKKIVCKTSSRKFSLNIFQRKFMNPVCLAAFISVSSDLYQIFFMAKILNINMMLFRISVTCSVLKMICVAFTISYKDKQKISVTLQIVG